MKTFLMQIAERQKLKQVDRQTQTEKLDHMIRFVRKRDRNTVGKHFIRRLAKLG